MCCRALLAAIAVTCTFTRIHALGPQRLDLRKDLLCVLILNEVQKEDLDESTLQKLRRHNVNINDLNNESVRNECKSLKLSRNKPLNTTEESNGTDNEKKRQYETQVFFINNNNNENKTEGRSLSEFEPNRNGSAVTETNEENNNTQKYNCNGVIKYNNGQPNLNSMMEFWKKCVNVKKTSGHYDYNSSSKIKHMNPPGTNKTSNNTFSKSDKYYKKPVAQNYTQNWEQRNQIVNNLYEYIPPAKYNSKINTENVLEHQMVYNQNPIKEYPNNKGMSEEPSTQKLYKALDNNYKNQTSKSGNIKELPVIHGDGFLNPGYRYTSRKESVNKDAISKTIPYIPNNNVLNSENIPNNDSYRRKLVKVDESPKFISNIALPGNKLFFPKNEPNQYLLTRESSNMNELMKIHDGNLFYPINKPYSDLYSQKPIQINHSYVTVPKISDSNYWYRENIPNKARTGILLKNEELPTFFQTTAEQNFHYSGNEPYSFRREPIKVTYLPKIIPNTPYKYLFYPELEPRFIIQNESKKKDDNPNILSNISNHNFSDNKNIFHTKSYSIEADLGKITKFFPNASTNRDNLYYHESTKKEFNLPSEAKRQDNLYNINYNIPKGNNLYRDNILSTIVHIIHNKTVSNINLTDDKPIKEQNIYNENEQNKFSQSKESVNIDKSVKVYNIQEGNVVYQKKEPHESLFTKETDEIKNTYKTSPNIVNSGLLFNGFAPNRDLNTEKIKLTRKLYDGSNLDGKVLYGEIAPTKSRSKSESIKKDESGIIYSTRDATNPNMLTESNVPVNNGLTNAIPNNIIIDIAESIKAYVLKDLKKEFIVASTTISKTTTPSTTTTNTQKLTSTAGNTQNISKSNESAIQYAVMKEVLKILEQMNMLKNNTLNVSEETPQAKNTNTNLIEGNYKTSLILAKTNTNIITRNTVDKSTIIPVEYNNSELKQQIMPAPITFLQTNLLDIPPLNFYMDRYLDPISQNIVLNTMPVVSNKQSDTRVIQANNAPRKLKKLQGIYPNTPYHRPSHNTAVNVNTNEKLRAAVSTHTLTHHNNKNVNIDQTYIKPSSKNIAPAYYTYNRPINTGNIMSARESSLVVDRQKCCDRQYVSQMMHDCCKERFVSRQQVSLNSAGSRLEPRIKSLIRTHQKVNSMLENILASRDKFATKFRSVENI